MKGNYSIRNILFLLLLVAGVALWFVNRPVEKDIPFIDEAEVEESVQRVGEAIQEMPKPFFSRELRETDSLHLLMCGLNVYSEAIFDQYAIFQQDSNWRATPLDAGWQTCAEQIIRYHMSEEEEAYGQALLNIGALLNKGGEQIQREEAWSQAIRPIFTKAFERFIQADSTLRFSLPTIDQFHFSPEVKKKATSFLPFVHEACSLAYQQTRVAVEAWKSFQADSLIPSPGIFQPTALDRNKWKNPKSQEFLLLFARDVKHYQHKLDAYYQLFAYPAPEVALKAALYEILLAENQLFVTYNSQSERNAFFPIVHSTLFYEFRAQNSKDTLDPNVLIP